MSMIQVNDLSKAFGTVTALDGLTFEVGQGEVVGFLGPNGAGKTTAMRIITGFFAPDDGSVSVAGVDVLEDTTEAQRHLGYLPENNPLYRDMLVADFLNLAAELNHVPKSERADALDFAVHAVGLEEVYYRPIGELSKGYRQRTGIAAALIHRPDVLLLDEPSEGLDPNQRNEIRRLLKDLAAEHTIIMSTHVMQEAQAVCDRLIIINDGQVIADGATTELAEEAQGGRVVVFEAEGDGIRNRLTGLDGVSNVDVETERANRILARITVRGDAELQPDLNRLARKHDWTIWRLHELEHRLEDLFHDLTSDDEA